MKLEKQIADMIEAEVRRRVQDELDALRPAFVSPVAAEIPDWMTERGFKVWEHGDASGASRGLYFKLLSDDDRSKLYVICPTFLRSHLSISSAGRITSIGY